jgi:hypothetical protein
MVSGGGQAASPNPAGEHIVKSASGFFALLLLFLPIQASGSEIVSMTTSLGSVTSFGCFALSLVPDVFFVDDGSSWEAGAGSSSNACLDLVDTSAANGVIQYTLSPRFPGTILQFHNYSFDGQLLAQGSFSPGGPLVLLANIGSTEATLSGLLQLDNNDDPGFPGFEHFAAPVGALVPFTDTLSLQSGGWDSTTFDSTFFYSASGQITFVPESPTRLTVLVSLLGMLTLSLGLGRCRG